jgi:glycosyltransferase involved in cell wall biosynthesis
MDSAGSNGVSARRSIQLAAYTDAVILGGAEQGLGGLIEALGPHVAVTVLGHHGPVVRALAERRPGTRFVALPAIRHKTDIGAMVGFARVLAQAKPDVLQINLPTPWNCKHETLIGALAPGVRTVLVEQLPVEPDGQWIRFVKRTLVRGVDAHIAVGVRAARQVECQIGLPRGTIRTIESAVPEFQVVRRDEGRTRPRIGTTARLDTQKGLDVLLRALPAVPDADLEIVGDGRERDALVALARELGIEDRVRFAGWSDNARRWLGRWDVFVLPSRFEGLPLAILDAMFAELPVVASDVGSIAEAVAHGRTGLLVRPDDPDALAAALRRLLQDPPLARRLGEAGREVALARFATTAKARRYEALYDELVGVT